MIHVFYLLLLTLCVEAFFRPEICQAKSAALSFKKKGGDSTPGKEEGSLGVWEGVKRFLPDVVRARFEKSFAAPVTETNMRYRLILLQQKRQMRRHAITRITRFLPDIQFETAAEIVDTAIAEEKALVRVLNSLDEAKFLRKMLLSADPPVPCEIMDDKDGSVVA